MADPEVWALRVSEWHGGAAGREGGPTQGLHPQTQLRPPPQPAHLPAPHGPEFWAGRAPAKEAGTALTAGLCYEPLRPLRPLRVPTPCPLADPSRAPRAAPRAGTQVTSAARDGGPQVEGHSSALPSCNCTPELLAPRSPAPRGLCCRDPPRSFRTQSPTLGFFCSLRAAPSCSCVPGDFLLDLPGRRGGAPACPLPPPPASGPPRFLLPSLHLVPPKGPLKVTNQHLLVTCFCLCKSPQDWPPSWRQAPSPGSGRLRGSSGRRPRQDR